MSTIEDLRILIIKFSNGEEPDTFNLEDQPEVINRLHKLKESFRIIMNDIKSFKGVAILQGRVFDRKERYDKFFNALIDYSNEVNDAGLLLNHIGERIVEFQEENPDII